MKIINLLTQKKLSLSFEVFPPKTETSFESVRIATEEIAKLCPAYMSVTYGAGGGTSKYTLDIAKNIKHIITAYLNIEENILPTVLVSLLPKYCEDKTIPPPTKPDIPIFCTNCILLAKDTALNAS